MLGYFLFMCKYGPLNPGICLRFMSRFFYTKLLVQILLSLLLRWFEIEYMSFLVLSVVNGHV